MKFTDIEKFSAWSGYSVQIEWNSLEDTLNQYKEYYNLDTNPDFQRGHVWTQDKQIAYVEYILKGGTDCRNIIFNCKGWNDSYVGQMLLVDGKQRLEAVTMFLKNELPVFNGNYLKDFKYSSPKGRRKVPRDYSFMFYIKDLATRKEVLKFYLDLNTGGVVHSNEEIDRVKQLLQKE